MANSGGKHVIIVGGGASGTLMACHLLRDHRDEFVVTLVERRAQVGPGIAYSTVNPEHLLNVRAGNMSAYADDQDHFWRWLSEQADRRSLCPDPHCFVQRRLYGEYMTSLLDAHSREGDRLNIVRGECLSVTEKPNGVAVAMADGSTHIGSFAVLATGNDAYGDFDKESYASPWLEATGSAGSDSDQPILVLGTGLTMVDYVLSAVGAGYGGRIVALSRRGLLPRVHKPAEIARISKDEVPFGKPPGHFCRWLRKRITDHTLEGGDWRGVIDGLRPYTQEIWRTFSQAARRRFLEHARSWWDVHRHRMAPEIASSLQAMLGMRRLRIVAAKITEVAHLQSGYRVSYQRRGGGAVESDTFWKIVDCRGLVTDPSRSSNPVIRSLLSSGAARPDPLRIGISVSADCAIESASGAPSRRIFAIGPLTRAALWECIAIPDIRMQCGDLARHLRYHPLSAVA
ncbi:FAD/NAD(P)-binding protein [Terrarubrum flagellatum]|uniref:FAD/NAD(P)-binding protein n=1 Tax=Terrirubrum flagellatum TaxID=2895980 RepID=UPI00314541FB